ncbi:sugar isomerase [Pseudactinotalea sp. HY160]|nr:sugar isomerase [Pseudactinotalea sp. HY160]
MVAVRAAPCRSQQPLDVIGDRVMSLSPSRRSFLLGASAALAVFATGGVQLPALAATTYEDALTRRRTFLTGGTVAADHPGLAAKRARIDARTKDLVDTFNRTPGRTHLWPGLRVGAASNTTEVANMGVTANQITELAIAWASPGSTYYRDASLLQDIHGACAFLSGQYRADRGRPGNWWFWEIGLPRQLADTLTLLGDQQPEKAPSLLAAADFFAPNPNRRTGSSLKETGANRVDKALACIVRGLLREDEDQIALGRDALSDTEGEGRNSLFGRVTSGDGFYSDGSFIQHSALPYSGTYGGVAISGVAAVMAMLAGSPWQVTDPDLSNLLAAVELTFAPFQWDVRTMDTTRGRAVSREASRDYDSGFAIASAVIVLAESAPADQRESFRALVKGWLERTTDQSVADNGQSLAASARSLEVVGDESLAARPPRIGITNTYNQERIVQHRGEWAAVVNTSSRRIGRYEWGNRENNHGWYQGDGMLFLYHTGDPAQYSADFWPTVDPYALPGITVNGEQRASGEGDGTGIPRAQNEYAGGLTVGDAIGTTAMDLTNATGTLRANKSWFHLTDSIVCIGSKISDTSGTGVRTIVENRGFATGALPAVSADGAPLTLTDDLAPARVVHVDGHAGILALAAPGRAEQRFGVRSQQRTGTWEAINSGGDTGGSSEAVARDYVRIEQAHESAGGWYAYQILPLADAARTAAAADAPQVVVVLADDDAHLIETGDGSRLGHFFAAGTWGGYTVTGACAIGLRRAPAATGGTAVAGAHLTEIVVAQPTKAGGTVSVTFPFDAPGTVAGVDETITVVATSPLQLEVDVDSRRGGEHRLFFASLATPEPVTVHHRDEDGEAVAPDVVLTGELGEAFDAVPVEVEGYELTGTPANASGTFGDEPVSVVFVYARVAEPTPTDTASPTPTDTASPTPTDTASPSPTGTASPTPTGTGGSTPTPTGSAGGSPTASGSGGGRPGDDRPGGTGDSGPGRLPSTGAGVLGIGALAAATAGAGALLRRRQVMSGSEPDAPEPGSEASDGSADTTAAE